MKEKQTANKKIFDLQIVSCDWKMNHDLVQLVNATVIGSVVSSNSTQAEFIHAVCIGVLMEDPEEWLV